MVEVATQWQPWVVCDAGFEVRGDGPPGVVPLLQLDAEQFRVGAAFRYRDDAVAERIVTHLAKVGAFESDEQRRAAVAAAFLYEPGEGLTDLASIPWFMRWFVNTYGTHTLAAILHDQQIVDHPNGGSLRSDVVADRFFRQMLHACGTSFMTRWIMWSAVALRTRFKAGGWKMAKVIGWGVSSVAGIGGTIWQLSEGRPLLAIGWGVAALVVAGVLWGRQWGAAVFAAIGLPFIAPAALLVLIAKGAFALLDLAIKRWDRPLPA
ncbi:MAG: DUF1353 domain-containing protein [Acidimicrobiia bacterium]